MNTKQIIFDDQSRKGILNGINKLTKAVSSTLGPKGRNVLISNGDNAPITTKDGVTVAKNIKLSNPIENIGAQAVIEAASKTADLAGDGTTTASILAESIYKEGLKYISTGFNPIILKRNIDYFVNEIVTFIHQHSKPIDNNDEIKQVAIVSANWDEEIGSIIAEAIEKVTKDGVVTVEESKTANTYLSIVEGTKFDRGYISPYFVNEEETSRCILENAYILLHEKKLTNMGELLPILQQVAKSGKPLLIVAEDLDSEILSSLVVNKLRGTLNVCAIKAPGFGERRKAFLDDLAILTGGHVVEADIISKLEEFKLDDLGVAKKIIVTKNDVTIIEGKGDKEKINTRINYILNQIKECTSDFEIEKYKERLSKLRGAVAIINIGASTEPELKEKRMRIDDALAATKAAIEEGISAGGSVTLLRALDYISKENSKFNNINKTTNDYMLAALTILKKALKAPFIKLCENAGIENHETIINNILSNDNFNYGFNIATETYGDLLKFGVIDPTKVARLSLQNACSVAGVLLSSECIIYEDNKNDKTLEQDILLND